VIEMTDVIERREFAATPEQVWRALTTTDGLRGWFWPPRLAAVDDQLENHVQGWSDCLDRLPQWLAAN
jgi:uncharacterized protein YndB with AHSA1/START domain